MRKHTAALGATIAVSLLCLSVAGCGVAARQTIQTVRGGYSDILVIQPVAFLRDYQTVDFRPLTSDVGGHISAELLARFHTAVNADLTTRGVAPPRGRVLRIQSRVIHIDLKPHSLHKEIILRVNLIDAASGKLVGVANIVGQAGGVSDVDDLATGLAKGIAKLLAEHRFPQLG